MTEREILLWVADKYWGTFYSWGGDDSHTIDCSGLVIECLKSCGRVPRKSSSGGEWDATANGLLQLGKTRGWEVKEPDIRPGALVFYLTETGRAIHVEIVWRNPLFSIGANGGGSKVLTKEDAIKANAFVKIRPWASRKGPYAFLDPFRELEVPIHT